MALVGISLCLDDRGRWRAGRDYVYADAAYGRAVEAAGGSPIPLPVQRDAEAVVSRLDALLLPGGDDFAPDEPDRYGPGVAFDPTPEPQLAFDRALLAAARRRDLPVLGICYGMQLMVLESGGRLHFDLPTDLPGAQPHRLPEPHGRHAVEIEPGARLAGLLDGLEIQVNSLHHQGVAQVGEGLVVSARSADGVVEAVQRPDAVFEIGVQWHPEKMSEPHTQALFAAFIDAARARK